MTAFDALMPGARETYLASGSSGGRGAAGDWRQAVEHAQARSWLEGRNTESGQGPQADLNLPRFAGQGIRGAGAEPSSQQSVRARQTAEPTRQGDVAARGSAVEASKPLEFAARMQVSVATLAPVVAPSVSRAPSAAHYADQAAMLTQMPNTRGLRPRKQSVHAESGEQGVLVWVRDASMNSQQANHLAAVIAASLGDGTQRLSALYLNGQSLADDRNPVSHSLFPPSPSE